MVDIMELDREIEALRMRYRPICRRRALACCWNCATTSTGAPRPCSANVTSHPARPAERSAATSTRRRRHHRLAVIPVAGALVLASTGAAAALSGSPHAPLYPLHRLVFGAAPSSDRQLGRDLAEAQMLLNRAAAEPYAARAGALSQARLVLAQAQDLLPRATSRTQFSLQLSAALARLAALETPPTTGGTLPLPTPLPSLLPKPQADSEGTTQPESANSDTESSGLAPRGGESEAPESAAPPATSPAGKAPEAVDSAATHQAHGESDDSPGTESGSPGSDPTDS